MAEDLLLQVVDSLQDIFDEYQILPGDENGMGKEYSFYSFGNLEVCISLSHLDTMLDGKVGRMRFPGSEIQTVFDKVEEMIPIVNARTGAEFRVDMDKGRNYTHIFVREIPF